MSKQASRETTQLTPYQREQDPSWARLAHRLTGIVMLLALLVGVAVLSLLRMSPNAFNAAIAPISEPVGVVGLIVVTSAAIFHALNTLRIAIVDLTTWGANAGSARGAAFLPVIIVVWIALTAAAAYAIGEHAVAEIWGRGEQSVNPHATIEVTPAAARLDAFTLALRISSVVLVVLAVGTAVPLLLTGDGIHRLGFAYMAARWSNPYWQLWDLLLAWLAVFHACAGLWRVASATPPSRQLWWRAGTLILMGVTFGLATLTILTFDPTLTS